MNSLNELSFRDIELLLECVNLKKTVLVSDFSIYDTEQVKHHLSAKMNRLLNIETFLKNYMRCAND